MAKQPKKGTSPKSAKPKAAGSSSAANPYGGAPNTGITLPPYHRPTPSVLK